MKGTKRGKGTKLGEGERDFWDYYANPDSGRLRSGLFRSGIVRGTDHFYFLSYRPRWPRQVQVSLWHVADADIFALKTSQMHMNYCNLECPTVSHF